LFVCPDADRGAAHLQNGKGIKDDLAVVHSYDPRVSLTSQCPPLLFGESIASSLRRTTKRARGETMCLEQMDADKPTYMRGPNILNAYDTLLIRARLQPRERRAACGGPTGSTHPGPRALNPRFEQTAVRLRWAAQAEDAVPGCRIQDHG